MEGDLLKWMQEWYYSQCNDEWEHGYGITIETIDNPGWSIRIDLKETALENKPFGNIDVDNDDPDEQHDIDWYACSVSNGIFEGVCGPRHLSTIIEIFKKWATE